MINPGEVAIVHLCSHNGYLFGLDRNGCIYRHEINGWVREKSTEVDHSGERVVSECVHEWYEFKVNTGGITTKCRKCNLMIV